jgi:MFS family permease
VSTVSAPDIEHAFATSHAMLAALLFVGPGIVALCIEPLIFLLADRYPRAWFVRGGLTALAIATVLAGLAPGPFALSCAISVCWIATGSAASLAQATLIDRAPDQRAKTMARWTLLALIGDILAPALLAGLGAIGLGWRAGYVIVGCLLGGWAVVTWLVPIPHTTDADDEDDSGEPKLGLFAALREALRDRVLMLWLFGLALCDLLDEILVVFATLHVKGALGGDTFAQSAVVATSRGSGAIGLVLLEKLLAKHGERTLLIGFGSACACAFAAWICAPNVWSSVVLMIPVGATSTPLYPLVAAQAFARRPDSSGAVLAASHLFTPLGLALPFAVGAIADHAGTYVALAVLIVQPIGLVVLALAMKPKR